MKIPPPDPGLLSLNTATVRERWSLREMIEGCARHGIGGMFPAADRRGRLAALDDNLRAIEDAATLGARCLVLVAGGLPAGSKDLAGAREMVRDGIGETLARARAAGVC